MEETYLQKKRRIMGRQFKSEYFGMLKKMTGSSFNENNIVSIVDSDIILDQYKDLLLIDKEVFETNNRFEIVTFLEKYLYQIYSPIFVWILRSHDCGLYKLYKITDINWYNIGPVDSNGIISILGDNYKILLDFYDEDGRNLIEIDIYQTNPFLT